MSALWILRRLGLKILSTATFLAERKRASKENDTLSGRDGTGVKSTFKSQNKKDAYASFLSLLVNPLFVSRF